MEEGKRIFNLDFRGRKLVVENGTALSQEGDYIEKDRIVIFGCGTGSPFFSTDTAAALRASEINADIIFKATNVDGVYDKDPKTHDDAKRFKEISYSDVLNKKLRVLDLTATSLCMDNNIPILVFDINKKGNLSKAVKGINIGTIIH